MPQELDPAVAIPDVGTARPNRNSCELSRRSLVGLGGTVALGSTVLWAQPAIASRSGTSVPGPKHLVDDRVGVRARDFGTGWRFFRGELAGGESSVDDSAWRVVDVPHDWMIEDLPNPTAEDGRSTADPTAWAMPANAPDRIGPFDRTAPTGRAGAFTVGGEGWYRKHFKLDKVDPSSVAYLVFDGIYSQSDVWLNGHHLGFNPYGYNELIYDLTPHLIAGENVVAVRVRTPAGTGRWYTGSGIYRDVALVTVPAVHVPVNGVWAVPHQVTARSANVTVSAEIRNATSAVKNARLRTQLIDPRSGRVVSESFSEMVQVPASQTAVVRADLAVKKPRLWSVDSPNLYTLRSDVVLGNAVVDSVDITIGLRSIELSGDRGLLLNGESVNLRGTNIHHDNGALGAAAFADAEERKVRLLKEAGFNAIRAAHTPLSKAFLNACDHLGVLVIDEIFDRWDTGTFAPFFDEWWRRITMAVVRRDRNHASIFMWSTGNEVAGFRPPPGGSPSVIKYGRALADTVRALDPNRPITQGGAHGFSTFFTLAPGDIQWDYLDVIDSHYQNDTVTQYNNSLLPLHNTAPDKALLVTESWNYDVYNDWKSVEDHPWNIGVFSWTGWDHLGEAGIGRPYTVPVGSPMPPNSIPNPGYPWVINYSGDLDLIGQLKPQMLWKRVVWGLSDLEMVVERPAPEGTEQRAVLWSYYDELASWTWPGSEGKDLIVRVYTRGDSVELFLNGRSIATKSVEEPDGRVVTFSVPYRPGTLTATTHLRGRRLASTRLETAGAPARLRLTLEERAKGRWNTQGRNDLAHVLVEVLDKHNRVVPDAVEKVSFDVSGPARLAGVGTANPHYVDSFQQPRRYTYHGQALVILQAKGGKGRVRLNAQASGLAKAQLTI